MSCSSCADIRRTDKAAPPCETETGCQLPPLGPEESRALEMRSMLIRLGGLGAAGDVLRLMGATRRDLRLMAMAEDALKEMEDDQP